MSSKKLQLEEKALEWPLRPWWDPLPPWLNLKDDLLRRFAELEIQFKIRELQLQQEKLEKFSKMLG
jgi:hypothetical protein